MTDLLARVRTRLTYANVIATLALFVALGGTSYAVVKLPRNSVGATQLRKNAVTSAKVRDHSLRAVDLAHGVLRDGATGPTGVAGAPGGAGARGETGATGTVDTTQFYDKSASDGRFLPLAGTAANAAQLGAAPAADYQRGTGTTRFVAREPGAGATAVIALPSSTGDSAADIRIDCPDPADHGTVRVDVHAGHSAFASIATSGGVISDYFLGASTPTRALAAHDHVVIEASNTSGSVDEHMLYDFSFTAGPLGNNQCHIEGFMTTATR